MAGLLEQGFVICRDVANYWTQKAYRGLLRATCPETHYALLLDRATTLEQFFAAAKALDNLSGFDSWKADHVSNAYDHGLLLDRIRLLKKAREAGDVKAMIFLLRTSLGRNIADMGNSKLYGYSRVGTKRLIDEYIDEVCRQLTYLAKMKNPEMPLQSRITLFANLQRAFGRTALLLSGGATFGLTHMGVIKTLFEMNLLPRVITGSSGGSIVAAAVCVYTDEELPKKLFTPEKLHLDVFETRAEEGNILHRLYRMLNHHVMYDIDVFIAAMRDNLGGDLTFHEAFNKTRRILNITVSSSTNFEMPRLLNYLTAPNVVIWSAVYGFLYFVYQLVSLNWNEVPPHAKKLGTNQLEDWNPTDHRWIDGSVEGDLPMQKVAELFNVNHFIVSQVNPHIIPFINTNPHRNFLTRNIHLVASLVHSEISHRLSQIVELGLAKGPIFKAYSIFSQKYSGDITIIPKVPPVAFLKLVENPEPDFVTQLTIIGERATWPELSIIKNHCQVEHLIEDLISDLKSRTFDRIPGVPSSIGENPMSRLAPKIGQLRLDSGSESASDETFHPFPVQSRKPLTSTAVRVNVLASPESEGNF